MRIKHFVNNYINLKKKSDLIASVSTLSKT